MFDMDSPWKIVALVAGVVVLRLAYTVWKQAPARVFMVELFDSALIAFALVFFIVRPFIVQAFYIPSESMVPTLVPRDRILVNKFVYHLSPVRRGDIVVFQPPDNATSGHDAKDFIKRVVGLPGDSVEVRKYDGVYINDHRLKEPYITQEDQIPRADYGPTTVPRGRLLVFGDNRNNSNDSRSWGFLPMQRIAGKAMVIFWPIYRMSLLH